MDAGDAVASVPSAASARGAGSAATAGGVPSAAVSGVAGVAAGLLGCMVAFSWMQSRCIVVVCRLVHIEGSKFEILGSTHP